jgi:hypothetical protein
MGGQRSCAAILSRWTDHSDSRFPGRGLPEIGWEQLYYGANGRWHVPGCRRGAEYRDQPNRPPAYWRAGVRPGHRPSGRGQAAVGLGLRGLQGQGLAGFPRRQGEDSIGAVQRHAGYGIPLPLGAAAAIDVPGRPAVSDHRAHRRGYLWRGRAGQSRIGELPGLRRHPSRSICKAGSFTACKIPGSRI